MTPRSLTPETMEGLSSDEEKRGGEEGETGSILTSGSSDSDTAKSSGRGHTGRADHSRSEASKAGRDVSSHLRGVKGTGEDGRGLAASLHSNAAPDSTSMNGNGEVLAGDGMDDAAFGFTCDEHDRNEAEEGTGTGLGTIDFYGSLMFAFPAALYSVADNISYIVFEMVSDPITSAIFGCIEIVIVGAFAVIFLKKILTPIHWVSLLMLTNGVASSHLAMCEDCSSWSSFHGGAFLLTILQCIVSALSSTFLEKAMRGNLKVSFFLQSAHLYGYGIFCNFVTLLLFDTDRFNKHMFFGGMNVYAYILIFLQAAFGLCTGLVLKYLGNISKQFISGASLVTITVVSFLLFGEPLDLSFCLSFITILLAMYLYNQVPAPKIRGQEEGEERGAESTRKHGSGRQGRPVRRRRVGDGGESGMYAFREEGVKGRQQQQLGRGHAGTETEALDLDVLSPLSASLPVAYPVQGGGGRGANHTRTHSSRKAHGSTHISAALTHSTDAAASLDDEVGYEADGLYSTADLDMQGEGGGGIGRGMLLTESSRAFDRYYDSEASDSGVALI